ncbi:ribonuclease H-like domain-containing protein [Schizophyllum commune]
MLPTVERLFASDLESANRYLALYFSPEVLADAPCVGMDTESWGRMERLSKLANAPMPLSRHASATYLAQHNVRLLQFAALGVVLTIDLWKTGGESFPTLLTVILEDPTIIKAGANLIMDAIAIAYREGHALRNGVELSHLYKCIYASLSMAPLSAQFSLAHLSLVVLGHEHDKELQTSDWKAEVLTPAQVRYSQDDALISYLVFVALERALRASPTFGFNANSFTFNCAYIVDGWIVNPYDQAVQGRDVKIWGVFDDPASPSSWSPKHVDLAVWSKGIYQLCRTLTPDAFCLEMHRRQLAYHQDLMQDVLTYMLYLQSGL